MRRALFLLPALLGLFIFGCKGNPRTQPDGSSTGGLQLASPARHVVSLSPGATEVLAMNGGSRILMGRTASCNYPPFVVKSVPVVMTGTKPDYEKISRLIVDRNHNPIKPDLFVYDPALFNDADVAQMTQNSRIKPFALDGDTIDEFIKEIKQLSSYYTGETYMSQYVDKIVAERGSALADPVKPTPRVAIIMPGEGSEHMIAGKSSFYADEVRAASGDPVGPDGNKFVTLNAEALLQWNPDIVITAGDSKSFENDPRFANLAAIKNHRVAQGDPDAMLRRGARVADVIKQIHNTMSGLMHGQGDKK